MNGSRIVFSCRISLLNSSWHIINFRWANIYFTNYLTCSEFITDVWDVYIPDQLIQAFKISIYIFKIWCFKSDDICVPDQLMYVFLISRYIYFTNKLINMFQIGWYIHVSDLLKYMLYYPIYMVQFSWHIYMF